MLQVDLTETGVMPTPALLTAMETNLLTHAAWLQARLAGARVVDTPDFLLVDSGFETDTFNFVLRTRLTPERVAERVSDVIAFFSEAGRPFSWWVGPMDTPKALGAALQAAGLETAETEVGMAASLDHLPPVDTAPHGLQVVRVTRTEQVADFAHLVAANWTPPDASVRAFYMAAAPLLLAPACPLRLYVGYLGAQPVAAAECCVAGGVAGLYNISTLAAERRRGFGTALTAQPLLDARADGVHTAILQAAPEGRGVYERVGFHPVARYVEYKPPA